MNVTTDTIDWWHDATNDQRLKAYHDLWLDRDGWRAEVERLREALGMAEVQQHEVAKALRIEPTGDSVYLHYQILAVLDAVSTGPA